VRLSISIWSETQISCRYNVLWLSIHMSYRIRWSLFILREASLSPHSIQTTFIPQGSSSTSS
jgi:hypothetical protein